MEPFLAYYGLNGPLWLGLSAGAIFLASLVLAVIFNRWLFPLILRVTNWIPSNLDTKLVSGIRFPITLAIILLGAYLALTLTQRRACEVFRSSLMMSVL